MTTYTDSLGKIWFLPSAEKEFLEEKYGSCYAELLRQYKEAGESKTFIMELIVSFIEDDALLCTEEYEALCVEKGEAAANEMLFARRIQTLINLENRAFSLCEKVCLSAKRLITGIGELSLMVMPLAILVILMAIAGDDDIESPLSKWITEFLFK